MRTNFVRMFDGKRFVYLKEFCKKEDARRYVEERRGTVDLSGRKTLYRIIKVKRGIYEGYEIYIGWSSIERPLTKAQLSIVAKSSNITL